MTETITIIEGPCPVFSPTMEPWTASIHEGLHWQPISVCQMRTFNSALLMLRCQKAWDAGQPVLLDYSGMDGLRKSVEILAAKQGHVEEGDLLTMWVVYSGEK